MRKLVVNKGMVFGRLVVLIEIDSRLKPNGKKERMFKLKCQCGNIVDVCLGHLRSGHTESCGCIRHDAMSKMSYRHGEFGSVLYRKWAYIKSRCYNPNVKSYPQYGGRGIGLYEEWINNPILFIEYCKTLVGWDDTSLTLDRIDNNKGYEPNNLRFVSNTIQSRNRRIKADNKTGYAGITEEIMPSGNKRYRASIGIGNSNEKISIGSFKSAKLAAMARNNFIVDNNLEGYSLAIIDLK